MVKRLDLSRSHRGAMAVMFGFQTNEVRYRESDVREAKGHRGCL